MRNAVTRSIWRRCSPTAVYGSAACGADILCLEAARELGCETHVVLPFPAGGVSPEQRRFRAGQLGRALRARARRRGQRDDRERPSRQRQRGDIRVREPDPHGHGHVARGNARYRPARPRRLGSAVRRRSAGRRGLAGVAVGAARRWRWTMFDPHCVSRPPRSTASAGRAEPAGGARRRQARDAGAAVRRCGRVTAS